MNLFGIHILNGFGIISFLQAEKEKTDKRLAAEE